MGLNFPIDSRGKKRLTRLQGFFLVAAESAKKRVILSSRLDWVLELGMTLLNGGAEEQIALERTRRLVI